MEQSNAAKRRATSSNCRNILVRVYSLFTECYRCLIYNGTVDCKGCWIHQSKKSVCNLEVAITIIYCFDHMFKEGKFQE